MLRLGKWQVFRVVVGVFFGQFFIILFHIFNARSTHVRWLLLDMHRLAEFSVAVRSCCRSPRSPRSSGFGAWPARAREPFALWRVWRPCSVIFWPCTVGKGSRAAVLWLGGSGDSACCHGPPSLAKPACVSSAGTVLDFLLVYSVIVFLCNF